MVKKSLCLIGFLLILFPIFCQNKDDIFSQIIEWSSSDSNGKIIISGEVKIQITIISEVNSNLTIRVQKQITPYSQFLDFVVIAKWTGEEYKFKGLDNFGNQIFGFLKKENNYIKFMMDCKKYSDQGKNLGRMFGDTNKLINRSLVFD